ncbi:MAG TPA: hypothetical protein VGG06_29380 [Thermoanaerobaculia bacterium]
MKVRSLLLALTLAAAAAAGEELVDRVVAVVDDDPIFHSDVERLIALGLVEAAPGEDPRALRRRVLDDLIDERLRLREVERFEAAQVSLADVDRQVALIRERYGGEDRLAAELRRLGLDEEGLRHLLTRQLRVLAYVDARISPRVFVDLDDVRAYYETELTAEMARQGLPLPPLAEVREAIRRLLRERRLNEEIEAWTEELRLAADVVDHFERPSRDLPPVVQRIEDE